MEQLQEYGFGSGRTETQSCIPPALHRLITAQLQLFDYVVHAHWNCIRAQVEGMSAENFVTCSCSIMSLRLRSGIWILPISSMTRATSDLSFGSSPGFESSTHTCTRHRIYMTYVRNHYNNIPSDDSRVQHPDLCQLTLHHIIKLQESCDILHDACDV